MYQFNNLYINDWYLIVGPTEKKSNIKKYDMAFDNFYFKEKTFEDAETKMQKIVLNNLLKNNNPQIVIASDLSNQLTISSMNMVNRKIPYLGLYTACSSSVAGIITLGNMLKEKESGFYITSSHNLTAEKQFRYPIEYGTPRKKYSTITATGSVGLSLSDNKSDIKVVNGLIGNVIDSYVKDANNMGAVMAPSACDTLINYLQKTNSKVNDYDLILTGDLGKVGTKIFKKLLDEKNIKIKNHIDAGTNLYKNFEYSGASGPACILMFLIGNIIPQRKYHKILLLATGSLHSPTLVNQKNNIPSITHALLLEVK